MLSCKSPPFRREKEPIPPNSGRKVTAYRLRYALPESILTSFDRICNNNLKKGSTLILRSILFVLCKIADEIEDDHVHRIKTVGAVLNKLVRFSLLTAVSPDGQK